MLDHDVFYNRDRSGYEELMSYYPNFWKDILEMRANNMFAGRTIDRAAADMEQIVADQFFESCSESMVIRYENFLNLDNSDKDWDERRRFLKIAWNGTEKVRVSGIIETIREFYRGMVAVDADFTDFFCFLIQKLNSDPGIDRNIEHYLQRVIPAHITYEIIYRVSLKCSIYAVGVMTEGELLEIRQVF